MWEQSGACSLESVSGTGWRSYIRPEARTAHIHLVRLRSKDFGINAVIAPSFGEIFKTNSMQNGVLPVVLPQDACKELYEDAALGLELTVDLEKLEVRRPVRKDGDQPAPIPFEVEPFRRHCLLNGLDDIALTLTDEGDITQFEQKRSELWPWLDGFGYQKGGGMIDAKVAKKKGKVDW